MASVWVRWSVDDLAEKERRAATPEERGRLRQNLERGDRVFVSWANSHLLTGKPQPVPSSTPGEGCIEIGAQFLDELSQMRRAARSADGAVSVGVGHTPDEAGTALELARAKGGDRACIYSTQTPTVLAKLREERDRKNSDDPLASIQPPPEDEDTPQPEPLLNDVLKAEPLKGDQFYLPGMADVRMNRPSSNGHTMKYVWHVHASHTPSRMLDLDSFGHNLLPHDHAPGNMPATTGEYEPGSYADRDFYEYGKIRFNNPLKVPYSPKWREELSEKFGWKPGKMLRRALKRKIYDGVIATDESGEPVEAVNIAGHKEVVQPFDPHIEMYKGARKLLPGQMRELPPGDLEHHPEQGVPGRKHPDTPEFRAWFKNSRAVDNTGAPLVVFHGTRKDFAQFDPSQAGSATTAPSAALGFFFSRRPNTADSYTNMALPEEKEQHDALFGEAERLRKKALRSRSEDPKREAAHAASTRSWQLYDQAAEMRRRGGRVIPAYLSLQNPLVYDMKNRGYRETSYYKLINGAKAAGHDGVIIRNTYDAVLGDALPDDVYIAFHPTQIKSAISSGFNENHPDITKSEREDGFEPLAKMALIHNNPKKPMTVYRVENENGEGPYDNDNPGYPVSRISLPEMYYENQPLPEDDFHPDELESIYSDGLFFAFEHPHHAERWFSREGLKRLEEAGYTLRPYKAGKVFRSASGRQVVFDPAYDGVENEQSQQQPVPPPQQPPAPSAKGSARVI